MSPVSPTPQKKPAPSQLPAPGAAQLSKPAAPTPAQKQKGIGTGMAVFLVLGVSVLALAIYFFGVTPRLAAKADLDHEQKISNQRTVIYSLARLAAPKSELPLPGTVDAFQLASIYAQTNGYVKRWLVDIGDHVQEGDILAELDTPEVDQQLSQAKANVEQATASLSIAQAAADRWDTMVKAHAVSQEEADEKDATRNEAKATLDADVANVARLTALENFKEIRAPFNGTITFRNIEVGNLVSSGNGTGTRELYRVAQTDPLRIYVDVPEANSPSIQPGVQADIRVPGYPDRVFHGEVIRSAGALDNASRTLRTEIRVPNPDGVLLPGAFAEVRLQLSDTKPTVLIPANTLIVNSAGTQVALVQNIDGEDKIHFIPVRVGRDFGSEVEILQDVKEGDHLVTNPAADLNEGAVVIAKALPKPATPAPAANPPPKS